MDDQRFDWLARQFGAQPSRRRLLASIGGLAVVASVPLQRASAGSLCPLICPADIDFFTSGTTCTGTATWGDLTVSPGCQEEVILCDFTSGDSFPLGVTAVTCEGQSSSFGCQFNVTGFDGGPIFATCPADISVEANAPSAVSFETVMVGTLCTPNTGPANCDHSSGDVFPLGSTTVTCSVPQGAGGRSGVCSFQITLAPGQATATATNSPTDVPGNATATPTDAPATTAPTTIPGDPTATEMPATVAPTTVPGNPTATTVPGDPTATTVPVTELPNTGSGDGKSGTVTKLLPVAIGGAGIALLTRLGLRQRTAETTLPIDE